MPNFNYRSALLLKTAIDAGITNPRELANIMGNASVETWQFTRLTEYLGYKSEKSILNAASSAKTRFTDKQIQAAVDSKDPQEIATILYEGRVDGLGNTQPGDGAKFIGRGFFQFTGRDNYQKFGDKFGVDLVNNPDQAAEPVMAAKLAIAYWNDRVHQEDRLDIHASAVAINGGKNGAAARIRAASEWGETLTPQLVSDIQNGKITLDQLAAMTEPRMMHRGLHGDDVDKLQMQLGELGYLPNSDAPQDGKFGRNTAAAVTRLQGDDMVPRSGMVGQVTQQAIDADLRSLKRDDPSLSPSILGVPGIDDPRNALNPSNALYNDMKQRFPDASDNRLLQFTAQCYSDGMAKPEDLREVVVDRTNATVIFRPAVTGPSTFVNLLQPAPQPQQSILQMQQFDRQQGLIDAQIRSQNAQIGQQQAPMQGGPQ